MPKCRLDIVSGGTQSSSAVQQRAPRERLDLRVIPATICRQRDPLESEALVTPPR